MIIFGSLLPGASLRILHEVRRWEMGRRQFDATIIIGLRSGRVQKLG